MRTGIWAHLDTAANPGAQTFLSAAALEANKRASGADRRLGVAADRNVRAPAVVSGCARSTIPKHYSLFTRHAICYRGGEWTQDS